MDTGLQHETRLDLDFVHSTIIENHPGVYNEQDPMFKVTMDMAYQKALASIQIARKSADHIKILMAYLQSFQDIHVHFSPKTSSKKYQKINRSDSSLKIILEDIVWISLPTFCPNAVEQIKELRNIIDLLPQYRDMAIIVFDIRGNTGGSSIWGTKIVEALFGDDYAQYSIYKQNKNMVVDWCVSQSNIGNCQLFPQYLIEQFGPDEIKIREMQAVVLGMQRAQQEKKHLYSVPKVAPILKNVHPHDPVAAKIVVIIDNLCVSACLDFIDELKSTHHDIALIGQTTNADTIYIETRCVDLPSGIGTLQFPTVAYRNRPRKNNQPYVPDIPFPPTCKSKKDIEFWLMSTIQNMKIH